MENKKKKKIPTLNDRQKDLSKILWEKEKMLVTSIFCFSHDVFYSFQKEFLFLSYIDYVVCKCCQFGPVQNLLFGKGLRLIHDCTSQNIIKL